MASTEPPLLIVEDLIVEFDGVAAVAGASLAVDRGSITGLIGPNGAGKTTLFQSVSGIQRSHGGRVLFAGEEITHRAPVQIAKAGLRRSFKMARPFGSLSVLENMMLGAPHQRGEALWRTYLLHGRVRREQKEIAERAGELLKVLRLETLATSSASTLSGGQRKLLDFGRALMADPELLLLDEPMAGVNPVLANELLGHILRLREERGMTFFIIEHDLDFVMRSSDYVVVMSEGKVITSDTPAKVIEDTRVLEAYLGIRG